MVYRSSSSLRMYVYQQHPLDSPSNPKRSNPVIFRDDHSFTYTPQAPILLSETSPACEKEWGEPPSSDEIFPMADLDEFVGTDFSYLRFFVPSNHQREAHPASQYDPYAEVQLPEVDSMPPVPLASLDPASRDAESGASLGPRIVPGFAPELPPVNSDAGLYGEPQPKPAPGSRFGRDYPPGSSSDADLYGSAPQNLSPPRGSDGFKSSQADDHHDHQLIRKFDTSTLLYVLPEVQSHSTIFEQWFETDGFVAPFLSCALRRSLRRSPVAHPTLQQKYSHSYLSKYRHQH